MSNSVSSPSALVRQSLLACHCDSILIYVLGYLYGFAVFLDASIYDKPATTEYNLHYSISVMVMNVGIGVTYALAAVQWYP